MRWNRALNFSPEAARSRCVFRPREFFPAERVAESSGQSPGMVGLGISRTDDDVHSQDQALDPQLEKTSREEDTW